MARHSLSPTAVFKLWGVAIGLGMAQISAAAGAQAVTDYGATPSYQEAVALSEKAVRSRLVDPDSAKFEWPIAEKAGMKPGMVISAVNGVPTKEFPPAQMITLVQTVAPTVVFSIIGAPDVTVNR